MMRTMLTVTSLLFLIATSAAAEMAGEMELREGYTDPQTGMRVEKIIEAPGSDYQEIVISVPSSESRIEQVVVTAPRIHKDKPNPTIHSWEFVDNPAGEADGVVLRLGKHGLNRLHLRLDATSVAPGKIDPRYP